MSKKDNKIIEGLEDESVEGDIFFCSECGLERGASKWIYYLLVQNVL